jgi:peptidoglycan pentaglycine glycine transferase (the first glycine)
MTNLKPQILYPVEPEAWDDFVANHADSHILQTSSWGALKSQFGWTDERVGLGQGDELVAGAQVLYRRLPVGIGRLAYVPKGPLVDWDDEEQLTALLAALDHTARSRGAIALTIEPDLPDEPRHRERLRALGFHPALFSAVQPRRTFIVDISPDEDAILKAMKSKTRYNVRLASRKGVTVRKADESDLPAFHALMAATAERDDFGVHAPAYYEAAYRLFTPQNRARLLLAEMRSPPPPPPNLGGGGEPVAEVKSLPSPPKKVEGEVGPVAALMVFALPPRAWYFYGASSNDHREKMPTYLLQWEAIRWAKSLGCTSYDLWGVPDEDSEKLEAEFTQRSDGLWSVYRFKRGFGGHLVRSVGAWDRVYAPLHYWLLTTIYRLLNR